VSGMDPRMPGVMLGGSDEITDGLYTWALSLATSSRSVPPTSVGVTDSSIRSSSASAFRRALLTVGRRAGVLLVCANALISRLNMVISRLGGFAASAAAGERRVPRTRQTAGASLGLQVACP